MTKEIDALSAIPHRFTLEGKGFRIKPHCLRVMGKINQHFSTEDNPNGYQYAIDKIYKSNDYEVAAEFIYLCLEKLPRGVNSMDDFKKLLLEENKDPSIITELIILCLKDTQVDFTLESNTSKKKVISGLLLMALATTGLIHMLIWLYEFILLYLNTLI